MGKKPEVVRQSNNQDVPKKSGFLGFLVMILGVVAAIFTIALVLKEKSSLLNSAIFKYDSIRDQSDKYQLLKTLALWLSYFLFGLTSFTMFLRIVTVSPNPAYNRDGLLISTLNKIISNTIEQSIIFGGLFSAILFDTVNHVQAIGAKETLALASLFVVGRIGFTAGYILAFITGIPTWRSFGFGLNLAVNILMISELVNHNIIGQYVATVYPFAAMIPL